MTDLSSYTRHSIDADDIEAVCRVLKSPALTGGPEVQRFETALAAYTGARYAVACSSGTAALHLACLAANVGPGITVGVPAITFVATANAVKLTGAHVKFLDCNPANGWVIKDYDTSGTTIVVDMGGNPYPYCGWIVDAAHSIGADEPVTYPAYPVAPAKVGCCKYTAMTCFSFHAAKNMTCGEGGAVTTNDINTNNALRMFREHGLTRQEESPVGYIQLGVGLNYRMTEVQAALGLSQLRKLDSFIARRRQLAAIYDWLLRNLPFMPVQHEPGSARHLYQILLPEYLVESRQLIRNALACKGIGTQIHYPPVYTQPYYRRLNEGLVLPGAESFAQRCLTLPLFPSMTDADPKIVVDALEKVLIP